MDARGTAPAPPLTCPEARRGQRGARYESAWARLVQSALDYARASSEDDRAFVLARDRLRKNALSYAARQEAWTEVDPETLGDSVEATIDAGTG